MAERECPICDTFWRLYERAADNLQELIGKRRDAKDGNASSSVEMLEHEIAIAERALGSVRRELRRHEAARHGENRQQSRPGELQNSKDQKEAAQKR